MNEKRYKCPKCKSPLVFHHEELFKCLKERILNSILE